LRSAATKPRPAGKNPVKSGQAVTPVGAPMTYTDLLTAGQLFYFADDLFFKRLKILFDYYPYH
jgi:hypothetical protein